MRKCFSWPVGCFSSFGLFSGVAMSDRLLRLVFGLVVCYLLAASAWSSTVYPDGRVFVEHIPNGARYYDGPPGSSEFKGRDFFRGNGPPGSARVTERYQTIIGGRSIEVAASRTITAAGIASAIGNIGAAAYVGWQVGSAIADIFDLGDPAGGHGIAPTATGWVKDDGIPPQQTPGYRYDASCANKIQRFGSPTEAAQCQAAFSNTGKNCTSQPCWVVTGVTSTEGNVVYVGGKRCGSGGCDPELPKAFSAQKVQVMEETCPERGPDPVNPAWGNRTQGGGPRKDGKCSSGNYRPASKTEVEQKAREGVESKDNGPAAAGDVASKGGTVNSEGEREMSGPPEVSDAPQVTTETTPDGKTRTTEKTKTTEYSYNGNEVTYQPKERTKVTECDAQGNCVVTQDGTTVNGEASDPCVKNPTRIGCINTGELPGDKPAWSEKNIPFEIVSLNLPSACPEPIEFELVGRSMTFSWGPVCGWAQFVKGAVIALAALSAMVWVMGAVKQ